MHCVSVAAPRVVPARRLLQAASLRCCAPRTASTRGKNGDHEASAACHRSRSFRERVRRRLRKSCPVALAPLACEGRGADEAVGTLDTSYDRGEATPVDHRVFRELGAALSARLHCRTLVLIHSAVKFRPHKCKSRRRRRPLLPGEDSNLQPTDYPCSEGFPPAWTISLPWRITAL